MARKNTSERLERALSRYDLEALPPKTQKMLEETMSRTDFDPDKLAEAIEREEAKREATGHGESKEPVEEHCPWYVALTRVLVFLGAGGFLFAFVCALLRLFFLYIDKQTDSDIIGWIASLQQSHQVIFYSVLLVGYLVVLFVLAKNIVEASIESFKGGEGR